MTQPEIIKAAEDFAAELEQRQPEYVESFMVSPGDPEALDAAQIIRSLIALAPKEGIVERIEEADRIILQLTMEHCSNPEYEKGFEMAGAYFHKYKEKP